MMMFSIWVPLLFIVILFASSSAARRLSRKIRINSTDSKHEESQLPGSSFATPKKDSMESRIFRLAQSQKGKIAISDVVIATGLDVKEAETLMDSMSNSIHVNMEVNDKGLISYEFPEIIAQLEDS